MTGIPFFEEDEAELREAYGAPGDRIVTDSGLVGVGTSTIAGSIADAFDLEHIDAGQFFREQAEKRGMSIDEFDRRLQEIEAEEDTDFDIEWDRHVLEQAFQQDDIVFEGRLTGAVLQDIAPVRVWVECDTATVAERLQERDTTAERIPADATVADLEAYVERRNEELMARYMDKYGIDPRDTAYYNVVIDNSGELDAVQQELQERVADLL
ncbi:MAG: cytidylate kinase family protein [Candidatus Nanohaloarchaea archaeon]|nr:cytidylate kinase family protein [Candidatus Nanohaloarchaea archaeon]